MNPTGNLHDKDRSRYAFNLALAAVVGQVGCLTLIIVMLALLGGIWLDHRLGSRPVMTLALMGLSIPVTVLMMIWVTRAAVSRLSVPTRQSEAKIQGVTKETDGANKQDLWD